MNYKFTNYCINATLSDNNDEHWIYYNTMFRSLILVPEKIHKNIQNKTFDKLDESTIKQLIDGYFLIPEFVDEKRNALEVYARQAYDMSVIDIAILTTYDCNFSCIYCNQKGLKKDIYDLYLKRETSDAILKWIDNLNNKFLPKDIVIGFFGGEPTLNFEEIFYFTKELREKYNNKVKFWMTTNGFLLEPFVAKKLYDEGVRNYQITIDGPQHIHDKRRIQNNGQPTFDKIIKNIEYLCITLKASVTVSVNIDQQNINFLNELLNVLESLSLKKLIKLNIAGVIPTRNDKTRKNIVSDKPLSNCNLITTAVLNGFQLLEIFDDGLCPYNSKHTFIIDPIGDFYKCVASVGDNNFKSGSVMNEYIDKFLYMDHAGNVPWLFDESEQCSYCSFLPLCWGGCRNQSNLQNNSIYKTYCTKNVFSANSPDFLRSLVVRKRLVNI